METENEKIRDLLRQVIDPELGIDIIGLGLVYDICHNRDQRFVKIEMTLTTEGCPMGDVIRDQMYEVLAEAYPFFNIMIEIVWTPEWSVDKMTPEARLKLARF